MRSDFAFKLKEYAICYLYQRLSQVDIFDYSVSVNEQLTEGIIGSKDLQTEYYGLWNLHSTLQL